MRSSNYANRVLAQIPPAELARLDLEPVRFEAGDIIYAAGEPETHLIFLESGLVGIILQMQDGRRVAVGSVCGVNGVLGASLLLVQNGAGFDYVVQIPVIGFRVERQKLRAAIDHSSTMRRLFKVFGRKTILHNGQQSGCNRLHTLEQRVCRWLLSARDGARADRFPVRREFIADMLGASRGKVSGTLAKLARRGLIRSYRGGIELLDPQELERRSCECYAAIRDLFLA